MQILLGGAQDTGKREEQQDAFYVSSPAFGHKKQTDRNLLVVCDGIGGASFGKDAAQIACQALKGFLMTEDGIYDVPAALLQAAHYANSEVVAFMISRGVRTVGGPTLITALIKKRHALLDLRGRQPHLPLFRNWTEAVKRGSSLR